MSWVYIASSEPPSRLFPPGSTGVELIGQSPAFPEIVRLVARMAACDAPVLIEGETGTGKELIARAIHYQSGRQDMPFIPVN